MVLILFGGILLFDPFIPGAWEHFAFLFVAIAVSWLLTEKASSGRYFTILLMCLFLIIILLIGFLPKNILESKDCPIGLVLLLVALTLLGYSTQLLLRSLLRATVITAAQIITTVNLYLFVGMFWAYVYTFVSWIHRNSFNVPATGPESMSNFIYFSFVTLASLGYGDIVPKTPFAQRLVIAEAIMGQFYIAIIVAYLLSVYIGNRSQGSNTSSNLTKNDSFKLCIPIFLYSVTQMGVLRTYN